MSTHCKRALILGIGGQDGSYLADVLVARGYQVYGMYRRSSVDNLWRIQHLLNSNGPVRVHLIPGDMADSISIRNALVTAQPSEVYNEADQDSVGWSHDLVSYATDITGAAVGRLLEFIRVMSKQGIIPPMVKVFQPCSAMMFGDAAVLPDGMESPQTEQTRFNPQSPYACSKCLAYYLCRHYRYQHGMLVYTAILYNHDSPRRSPHYLLHKICTAASRIRKGIQSTLALGNLDAQVDVGFAGEYMEAVWSMLQQAAPDDYIISTGRANSVESLVKKAFDYAGVDMENRITVDPNYYKPTPKSVLVGDYSKAKAAFGFEPQWDVDKLIRLLVDHAALTER